MNGEGEPTHTANTVNIGIKLGQIVRKKWNIVYRTSKTIHKASCLYSQFSHLKPGRYVYLIEQDHRMFHPSGRACTKLLHKLNVKAWTIFTNFYYVFLHKTRLRCSIHRAIPCCCVCLRGVILLTSDLTLANTCKSLSSRFRKSHGVLPHCPQTEQTCKTDVLHLRRCCSAHLP